MTATRKKIRIGEVLVEEGILSQDQLHKTLAEQKQSGQILGEMLVSQGLVTGKELIAVLSRRLGVRGCQLRIGLADPALLEMIGQEEAIRLKALPMFRIRETLTVAMAEPQSLPSVDRLGEITGCQIRAILAMEGNIVELIRKFAGATANVDALMASLAEADLETAKTENVDEAPVTGLDQKIEGSPVVNLVNMMLLKAIQDGASDVHIEPDKTGTRVRYRIDGVLRDLMKPPPGLHASIASRVKVIGKMDIAEKRLPQEGRVRLVAEGREIDFRISSMPTMLGEKIVVRILDKANLKTNLDDLGFSPGTLASFHRILRQPHGLVLVTGPTGSGKTTTLYSALELIRSPELNIVTIEDPVEYQLDLINQIQVQSSIGMTFAHALRSILRQDPDVIMVGEIRDGETAAVAVQAALTGHLVLATLHTNDAIGAIARLVDMGIEPYMLSSALNGAVAQRLVRLVCRHCSQEYQPHPDVLQDAGLADRQDQIFVRGAGCDRCHNSGFQGRAGIYEVMEITGDLRNMIHRDISPQQLRTQWQQQGGLTLRQEGLLMAMAGRTSLEEILAATHDENQSRSKQADRKLTAPAEAV